MLCSAARVRLRQCMYVCMYVCMYLYSAQYLHILQDSKRYLTNPTVQVQPQLGGSQLKNLFIIHHTPYMTHTGWIHKSRIHFYLPPAATGRMIIKRLSYLRLSIHHIFYINLNISFIYKNILTKFEGMFMAMKTCLCKILASFGKNKMAAIANCLKIIKMPLILKYCS